MKSSGVRKKHISPQTVNQIQVLIALSSAVSQKGEIKKLQIEEISELSGLKDEKETQRYLFILEGQRLVSPFPVGDFTAKQWHITEQGVQTLKHITQSIAA